MQFSELILITLIVLGAIGAVVFYFNKQINKLTAPKPDENQTVLLEWLKDMKGSVEKNSEVLEKQLQNQRDTIEQQMKSQRDAVSQQTKMIWERLDKSQDVIREVQKQLGGITEFGKDMKDLSNVLKSPKLRGGLGEQFLYEILANYLPADLYKTQYVFKSGIKCDAVVFTDKGIIPIDSKFSMENFKAMIVSESPSERDEFRKSFIKDCKKRIDEISSKYLLPEEGTTEQAVMYIPSENVYYELLVNTPEVEDYAKAKNVVMTSPNTLSYFLKVLLVGYQQHELEKNANEILKALAGIKIEAEKFGKEYSILEKHISDAYKATEKTRSGFTKLTSKIENVQGIEAPAEQPKLPIGE